MPRKFKPRLTTQESTVLHGEDQEKALFMATKLGYLKQARSIIRSGVDPNVRRLGLTPIYFVVLEKNIAMIKMMVSEGANLNVSYDNGMWPLYAAVREGSIHVVKCLIDLGADIHTRYRENGNSLLHFAALDGHVDIINLLIDKGLDVNDRSIYGATPLQFTSEKGHIEAMKVLLARGADVNAKSEVFGKTLPILCMASQYCHIHRQVDTVKTLLKAGANVNSRTVGNSTALHIAALKGPVELVKVLLKAGIDVNARDNHGEVALHQATVEGHVKIVGALLNVEGIEVNPVSTDGMLPLHRAAELGHLAVVKLLVAKGSPINSHYFPYHRTPLMLAFYLHKEDVAGWLIRNGAEIQDLAEGDMTALHKACSEGFSGALIKTLIEKGCGVNAKTKEGVTPLMVVAMGEFENKSAQKDNVDLVKCLISLGADPNEPCAKNFTPLHYAARNGWAKMVEYLITVVRDINHETSHGETPLLLASMEGHFEIARVLLKNGANPDIVDKLGQLAAHKGSYYKMIELLKNHGISVGGNIHEETSLFCAAETNNTQMAELLLQNGANVNMKNSSTRTPLHIACENGNTEVVEVFLKYTPDVDIKTSRKGYTPLYCAVKSDSIKVVKTLLEYGADVNACNKVGILPIHVAARTLNMRMVLLLLSHGAYFNVEAQGKNCTGTPSKLALKAKDFKLIIILELVRQLISAAVENDFHKIQDCIQWGILGIVNARNVDGRTALHYAVMNGSAKATEFLLQRNADITLASNEGDLSLHIAASYGNEEILNILLTHAKELNPLKRKGVINSKTMKDGTTSLHTAAKKNNLSAVKLLLENGAVYNIKNKAGKTPMHLSTDNTVRCLFKAAETLFSIVKNDKDFVEDMTQILKQCKSIVNSRDSSGGGTLLYWSAAKGHAKIVDLLLDNGADYRLVTSKGTSPLHIAASKGYTKIVQSIILKMYQEDMKEALKLINEVTPSGTAPLHVASNKETVCFLLIAGAEFNVRNRENKTTLDLTQNKSVRKMLENIHQCFIDVEKGGHKVMDWLRELKSDILALSAVLGTRNELGQPMSQVAIVKGNTKLAIGMSEYLLNLPSVFNLFGNGQFFKAVFTDRIPKDQFVDQL